MKFLKPELIFKSFRTIGVTTLSLLFISSCATQSQNIKIYSISTGSKKPLKQMSLIGVGDCRDNSIRIKFIDNKKINDTDYSAIAFKPGVHRFTIDIDDEKLNNKELKQRINIEWRTIVRKIKVPPGKFYLVCPVQKKNKEWTFWLEERKFEFEYYYKYRDNIDFV